MSQFFSVQQTCLTHTPPYLHFRYDLHLVLEWHHFAVERLHGHDVLAAVVELHRVDSGEELLEVRLDDLRVGGLTEDLEQIVVSDEVETREQGPLLLRGRNEPSSAIM